MAKRSVGADTDAEAEAILRIHDRQTAGWKVFGCRRRAEGVGYVELLLGRRKIAIPQLRVIDAKTLGGEVENSILGLNVQPKKETYDVASWELLAWPFRA